MQLRQVSVEEFRPFESASVRLPETGLVLVAGANNSGKSALLSALDVVAGIGSDTQALRHAGSERPARVAATFTLTTDERFAMFALNPHAAEFSASGAADRLQLVFEEQPSDQPLLAQVLGEWPGRGLQTFMTVGPREGSGGGYTVKVIRGLLPGEDSRDPLVLVDQGQIYGPEPVLQAGLQTLPQLNPVLQMRSAWKERYYHFQALRPGTQRTAGLMVSPTMQPTGENLTAVLLDLLTNRPEIFGELRRLIAEIVPGIGQLEIRTSGSSMQVVFAMGGAKLNLKDLGTGVEQLLMTLVVGLTESPPFTLVIEEPETNLHPAAQRALLGLLKDWSTDRQIVVATHSPVLLDWSPAGERLWHVTRAHGSSTVAPAGEDFSVLLRSLGVRRSDVLSASRVLVLEGPSDEDILGVWFPEVLRNPAVAVLHGRGGDNARHADQLAEWLTGVDKIGLRRVLYLRDRDELSASAVRALQQTGTVEVLKRRELENYLLDPSAVASVLGEIIPDGVPKPSAPEVAAAMTDAAENLRHMIVVNRICRQIRPDRPLMDHKLRQRLAAGDADEECVTTAILERLMTKEDLQAQIQAAWKAAEEDVARHTGDGLLAIAPGEEILKAVFLRFGRRGYNKRDDGLAIARAMLTPPEEIRNLLDVFMLDKRWEEAGHA